MWIAELCVPVVNWYAVAIIKALPHINLALDHGTGGAAEVGKGSCFGECFGIDKPTGKQVGNLEDSESECFAGNGPFVRAVSTNHFHAFDDGDGPAQFGRLHHGPFTAWSRTDHNNIISMIIQGFCRSFTCPLTSRTVTQSRKIYF